MQWLIQDTGVTFDCLDRNVKPLVEAVDRRGLPRTCVGYVPFVHTLTGIEGLDRSVPTVFYGSTKLAELSMTSGFWPGGFYDAAWFDPGYWVGKRTDLLNEKQMRMSVGCLRQHWITEPVFVKSVDPKALTGMVLEGPDRSWWVEEHSHLADTDQLVISPIERIDQEWRFFIVEGEVVAGSQYKHDGLLRIREPIDSFVWYMAKEMAKRWLPAPTIVMDVCLTRDKWFKVVEFNCVNSSGFYNADVGAFVDAMEKAYGNC